MDKNLIKAAIEEVISENPDVLIPGINAHEENNIREMNLLKEKTPELATEVTTEAIKTKTTTVIEAKVASITNPKTFQGNKVKSATEAPLLRMRMSESAKKTDVIHEIAQSINRSAFFKTPPNGRSTHCHPSRTPLIRAFL